MVEPKPFWSRVNWSLVLGAIAAFLSALYGFNTWTYTVDSRLDAHDRRFQRQQEQIAVLEQTGATRDQLREAQRLVEDDITRLHDRIDSAVGVLIELLQK